MTNEKCNNYNTNNNNSVQVQVQPQQPIIIPITFPYNNTIIDNNDNPTTTDSTNGNSCSTLPQWTMIELNGELLKPLNTIVATTTTTSTTSTTSHHNNNYTACYELGSLQVLNSKEATMIIGSHEMKGLIEPLKQPYCVLRKKKYNHNSNNNDNMKKRRRLDNNDSSKNNNNNNSSDNENDSCTINTSCGTTGTDNSTINLNSITTTTTTTTTTATTSFFHIIGVVSSKIIFNKYPKTIIRK